ncbi:hypothetical protein F442_10481 [Phytophthora nicotianae P10297]|uniref:Uncharacterized protein n=1 Tax=Phytophthora nicotianae P10297 TaxID=1317064 RepID=W2Z6C4_PHYNI|nr:hypothetical protein F442_10481 [Phytophthora nicotianae P10297]
MPKRGMSALWTSTRPKPTLCWTASSLYDSLPRSAQPCRGQKGCWCLHCPLLRSNVVYRWGLHYDPTHSTERSFVDGASVGDDVAKDEFAVEGFEELLLIPVILVVVAAMGIGWFCWKRSSLLKREQASSCDFDVVLQITWMSLLTNKLFDGR